MSKQRFATAVITTSMLFYKDLKLVSATVACDAPALPPSQSLFHTTEKGKSFHAVRLQVEKKRHTY